MKPFETGCKKVRRRIYLHDALFLKEASGSIDSLDMICPYAFREPLAPEPASAFDRVRINLTQLDRIYGEIDRRHDIVLVEGAGGILVPIKNKFFYVDLIERWKIPVLIVARLGLGTINHTLLTTHYLHSRGVKVLGVILNDTDGVKTRATLTNPQLLKKYLPVPVLGIFPYIQGFREGQVERKRLATLVSKHIHTEKILKALHFL